MDDNTALLQARALIDALSTIVDRLADDKAQVVLSDDERRTLAGAVLATRGMRPRSLADSLRWVEALEAGDEGWLILHSIPGERRAEARYHSHLGANVRRNIG